MANSFNWRIKFTGGEEAKNILQDLARSGEQLSGKIRGALQDVNQPLKNFETGTKSATVSNNALKTSLTNLSFQVNDVATSLASGGDPSRVFAQQIGQIVQAFQQGGGLSAVLSAGARAVGNFLTPLRVGIGVAAAFAAAVALIAKHSADSDQRTREFDVQLRTLGKGTRVTGKDLEAAAQRLRDVGLSATEAGEKISKGLAAGVNPNDIEKVVRAGANLNAVLGEGSLDAFIEAAGKGGAPLREFAQKLGIVPPAADDMSDSLKKAAAASKKFGDSINDAFEKRGQAIFDEKRRLTQEIADLSRKRGTAEEEATLQSSRRITEINRDTNRQINEIIKQRNKQAQDQLKEFNDKVEKSAQEAADNRSIIDAITGKVNNALRDTLGPAAKAIFDLRVAWAKLINDLSKSQIFTGLVSGLAQVVSFVAKLLAHESGIGAVGAAILVLLPILAALRTAVLTLIAATGPWTLAITLVAGAILLIALNWDTIVKKLGEGVIWLRDAFNATLTAIAQFIGPSLNAAADVINGVLTALQDAFNGVLAWFKGLWSKAGTFVADWAQFLMDKATEAISWVEDQINGLVDWFKGAWKAIQDSFQAVTDWIQTKINDWLGWFGSVLDKAARVAAAIRSAIGGNAALDQAGAQGGVNAARGGQVWGAGTATSDSIRAWLSNGEFVVNAFATRKWLPLLRMINRGLMPKIKMANGGLVPRTKIPRFALGGPVMPTRAPFLNSPVSIATSGMRGTLANLRPVNIQIGDQVLTGLHAPEDETAKIIQRARQMLGRRIGRKPGWYGG